MYATCFGQFVSPGRSAVDSLARDILSVSMDLPRSFASFEVRGTSRQRRMENLRVLHRNQHHTQKILRVVIPSAQRYRCPRHGYLKHRRLKHNIALRFVGAVRHGLDCLRGRPDERTDDRQAQISSRRKLRGGVHSPFVLCQYYKN
mgnify:CR=1 FL=1